MRGVLCHDFNAKEIVFRIGGRSGCHEEPFSGPNFNFQRGAVAEQAGTVQLFGQFIDITQHMGQIEAGRRAFDGAAWHGIVLKRACDFDPVQWMIVECAEATLDCPSKDIVTGEDFSTMTCPV